MSQIVQLSIMVSNADGSSTILPSVESKENPANILSRPESMGYKEFSVSVLDPSNRDNETLAVVAGRAVFSCKQLDVKIHRQIAEQLKINYTIVKLDLTRSHLDDEGVKALAEALKVNHILRSLIISWNRFNEEGGKALTEALKVNHTLTLLNLAWNKAGKEMGQALAEALKVNVTLRILFLDGNNLGKEGGKALAGALRVNRTLHTLYLGANNLGEEGGEALVEALQGNDVLQSLHMQENALGEATGKALARALKVNQALQTLDLSSNKLGRETGKALTESLQQNQTLTFLDCSSCSIPDYLIQEIEKIVEQNRKQNEQIIKVKTICNVHDLSLQKKELDAIGVETLAEVLASNRTCKYLTFGQNNFRGIGGLALAKALKVNYTLQSLDMRSSMLDNTTGVALANALKVNRSLQFLYLRWTRFGKGRDEPLVEVLRSNPIVDYFGKREPLVKSGVVLAEALKINSTLRVLDLSSNGFDEEEGQAIAEALTINETLEWLDLSNNRFGEKVGKVFSDALRVNRALHSLNLKHNDFNDNVGQVFSTALQSNLTLTSFDCSSSGISYSILRSIERRVERNRTRIEQNREEIAAKIKELMSLGNVQPHSARHSLCRLAGILPLHYNTEKTQILHTLLKLIGSDSLHSDCAIGLIDSACILMAQLDIETMRLEFREMKNVILGVYVSVLDLIALHHAHQHVSLPNQFKSKLEQANECLAKLEDSDHFISLQFNHIKEATAYLLNDERHLETAEKMKIVLEALHDAHREPDISRDKVLMNACTLPTDPELWYSHFLGMRQLLPTAMRNKYVLGCIIRATAHSMALGYTRGLELLYHVAQGNNKETSGIAIDFLREHVKQFDLDSFQRHSFDTLASENYLERSFKVWKVAQLLLKFHDISQELIKQQEIIDKYVFDLFGYKHG